MGQLLTALVKNIRRHEARAGQANLLRGLHTLHQANYQDLSDLVRSGPDANERYYVSDSPDANESSSERLGPSRSDADRNAQRC